MKSFASKLSTIVSTPALALVVLMAAGSSVYAAQTATGPVNLWSLSRTPGFSLISVGGGGDGGTGSVLCQVDATSEFGGSLMASAASAAFQTVDITLTCTDLGQAQSLQLLGSSD